MGEWGFCFPPTWRNFLENNIIFLTCLWVRKIHVGIRIKGGFGHYGLFFIKPCQTGRKFEFPALNKCSFLNTDPIFTK